MSGEHDMKELQKSVLPGAPHVLREVLIHKQKTFIMGNNITCAMNCKQKTAGKLYTVETWFVPGVTVSTLHKVNDR